MNYRLRARQTASILTALAALIGLALGLSRTLADHPSDLKLTLSVLDNAAAVAPSGSTITIQGEFTYAGQYKELALSAGELRIGGAALEWETGGGRTRLTLPAQRSGVNGALTGFAVAVEERDATAGGNIVVVGAPKDRVDDHLRAGSVDVFVNGTFVTRLTAGADAAADAQFGYSVDVAGSVIVVGAPFEGGILDHTANDDPMIDGDDDESPQGAVYVFTWNSTDSVWEQAAKLTPVNYPLEDTNNDNTVDDFYQTRPIAKFGMAVAIDDAGDNIVVGHEPGDVNDTAAGDELRWESLGHVFTKPSAGWANQTIVKDGMEPEVAYLLAPAATTTQNVGLGQGDLDISGDGDVIAVGVPDRDVDTDGDSNTALVANFGGVLIYPKPSAQNADWKDAGSSPTTGQVAVTATLDVSGGTTYDSTTCMQLGESVALDSDGDLLVVGAPGAYTTPCGGASGTPTLNTWKGAAFVFAKPSGNNPWANAMTGAALTEPDAGGNPTPATDGKAGELFGQSVAINDAGTRIIVGNAADPTTVGVTHAKGYAHVYKQPDDGATPTPALTPWVDDASPDVSLTSPLTTTRLAFGSGVALDGASTAVVGQAEALEHLSAISGQTNITTGHGRAYTFSLASDTDSEWQGTNSRLGPITMPCTSTGSGENEKWTCDLTGADTRIVIPPGTADGTAITISSTGVTINGDMLSGNAVPSLSVRVGQLSPVDSTEFTASGGTSVETNTRVDITLKLRAGGRAASPQVISSVLITANGGQLSSPAGGPNCARLACSLDIEKLHSTGHDVILTDNIPIQWTAPNNTGRVVLNVRVDAVSGSGGQPRLNSLRMTVTGAASGLQISAPARPLYYQPTSDDDNDVARFEVKAVDREDNAVPPPDQLRTWDVKIGGTQRSVKSNFTLTRDPATGRRSGKAYLVLTVTGNGLSPGSYQLEASLGRRAAGTRTFSVVGSPGGIRLSESGQRTFGGRLIYEARVTDSNGNAVVDGTTVTFSPLSVGNPTLAPSVDATRATSGGLASTSFIVVGTGSAVVRACAGSAGSEVCDVQRFSVGGFIGGVGPVGGGGGGGGGAPVIPVIVPPTTTPPPTTTTTTPPVQEPEPPPPPATLLSAQTPNSQVTWDGTGSTTASELFEGLTNIPAIFLWNGERWLPYGRAGEQEIPGSIDFVAFAGAVIWLSAPDPTPAAEPDSEDEGESEAPPTTTEGSP